YPFDSTHHQIIDSLINDEDDELTSDFPSNTSSISLGGKRNPSDDDNQDSTQLNDTFSSYSDKIFQTEKPRDNEEIYKFLVRVLHLISKVRVFVSITRPVAALQCHIYNKLGFNKVGFILDVR
ncbi:unnamed protein product, partial [Rotaria sp. Silwood1]